MEGFLLPVLAMMFLTFLVATLHFFDKAMKSSEAVGRAKCMIEWCDYGKSLESASEKDVVLNGLHKLGHYKG